MSLTSYLKDADFNKEFSKYITLPKVRLDFPMRVTRMVEATGAARMGTALDYAIRFYLERHYGAKHVNRLIADMALDARAEMTQGERNIVANTIEGAKKAIREAKGADSTFAWGCYQLANLDVIVRSGIVPKYIPFPTTDLLLGELRQLLKLAVQVWPAPKEYCLLNPTFGHGSMLTGGADADVVQDGCIYDSKCVVKLEANEPLKQVIGYYILSTIGGVDGLPEDEHEEPINEVAIYFARHGVFVRYPIHELVSKKNKVALQELFMNLSLDAHIVESPHWEEPGNEMPFLDDHGEGTIF